jgi:hypothetical protein
METWFAEAVDVPSLEAEVCFLLKSEVYHGPDQPSDPSDLKRLVEPLPTPVIPRFAPSMVRTAEAVGHEAQLASHYREVVRIARKHRRPFNAIRHHFWLRFWLWDTERKIYVCFPWYDSFSEIEHFMDALAKGGSGLLFHDQDQGWEMEVHSLHGNFYFRERDPDADETRSIVCVPRDSLLATLASLRGRTAGLIEHLSAALGADVWSSYVRNEPAFSIERA